MKAASTGNGVPRSILWCSALRPSHARIDRGMESRSGKSNSSTGKPVVFWGVDKKTSLQSGTSILEVLIAVAVLTLGIAASTMLAFANQSITLDSEISGEALNKVNDVLENARADSLANFNSVVSTALIVDSIYSKKFDVSDLTPCRKEVMSSITWSTEVARPQKIELKTDFTDIPGALALGGDCDTDPPVGGWTALHSLSSADFIPAGAKATDIDVLNKIVFISASDPSPAKDDLFVFDATALGSPPQQKGNIDTGPSINSMDAIPKSDGFYYIFAANHDTTNQFQVIKVPQDLATAPQLIAQQSLAGVNPLGSYPQGWRIYYLKDRVYIVARETQGPEFHIFNVTDPFAPNEIASFALNRTTNALVVREQTVNGQKRRVAFLAMADNDDDLIMLDVTDPVDANTFRLASLDLSGNNDGKSIYLVGNTLYVGKASSGIAPELFLINIDNLDFTAPHGGMQLKVEKEMGVAVNDIRVSGRYGFLATSESNKEFQIWNTFNVSTASDIYNIAKFNYSQKITAIEYEDGFIYTANESNDALRIIRPAQCADKIDDDGDGKIDSADPQCHTDGDASNAASYDREDDSE